MTAAAVRSLRAKIVIVGNSIELKIIIFVLNYLTDLVKQLLNSVSVDSGKVFTCLFEASVNTITSHLHFSE